jgi:imidazolonepropionase
MSMVVRNARVLTLAAPGPRRRAALADLGAMTACDVVIEDGRITGVGPNLAAPAGAERIDAGGRVLMPGFIDCHTHACWAGDRLDEWAQRLAGVPYLDILAGGGGIMSTVRAVRAANEAELSAGLRARLDLCLRAGTTTVEVKSGYGLSTEHELKMLRAIRAGAAGWPGTVVPTALLGHAIDPAERGFVDRVIRETLPAVHAEFAGIAIDAFCEQAAWSRADVVRLFEAAKGLGHPIRVHADQFNSLGIVHEAVRLGARSVDHLEATTAEDAAAIGRSDTYGVILPATPFHLGTRQADGRALIDAGAALCIATNCNPGSSPTFSIPLVIALAVRQCGLTPAEAIAAATVNPGSLLGLADRGRIAPGCRADLVLLRHSDERQLAYEFGGSPVDLVIVGGVRVVS